MQDLPQNIYFSKRFEFYVTFKMTIIVELDLYEYFAAFGSDVKQEETTCIS